MTSSSTLHRFVRTKPALAEVTAPTEARTPTTSTDPWAPFWRTRSTTPRAPTTEASRVALAARSRRNSHASAIVTMGLIAVNVAPSPLGSRTAAT